MMSSSPQHPRPFTLALAPTLGLDPRQRIERAKPLAAFLERSLGEPVALAVETSYAASLEALREGRIDAAMLGELAALRGARTGAAEPLVSPVGDDGRALIYQSVIFTRLDTGIHDLSAMRGREIGLVDEQSASGYLAPRDMLREAGVDPDRDVQIRLFRRHTAVVEAVLAGEVPVGGAHADALRPPHLDRGPAYARLSVLATSRPLPRGPLVVRLDLPPDLRQRLVEALLRVQETDPHAAEILNVGRGQRFTIASRRAAPTLRSIAQLAGVSYATVSRVVNGSGYVSSETAARVRAIVQELGYRPNGNALTLHGHRLPLVGFMLPAALGCDMVELANSVRRALAEAGVPLVLCPVDATPEKSPFLELLRDGRLGALLVTAAHAHDPSLIDVARTGRAVIAVDVGGTTPGMIQAGHGEVARVVLGALGRS